METFHSNPLSPTNIQAACDPKNIQKVQNKQQKIYSQMEKMLDQDLHKMQMFLNYSEDDYSNNRNAPVELSNQNDIYHCRDVGV